MIHFKEKPLYITTDSGIIHYSSVSLEITDKYNQDYQGMNREAIKYIIQDIRNCQKELDKLLIKCYDYEINLNTNKLF